MEQNAQAYCDMPSDLLPTANFANQPFNDISTLDGLWTIVISSSDSSTTSTSDDEDSRTPQAHSPAKVPPSSGPQSQLPERLHITVSAPSNEIYNPRMRSLSSDVKIMDRPRIRKKARTAPPSNITPPSFISPWPRRAISARPDDALPDKWRNPQPYTDVEDGRSALDYAGTAQQKPLPQPGTQPHNPSSAIAMAEARALASFSQKAEVQETLQQKQLGLLDTSIGKVESKKYANTPKSMLSMPRELYAISETEATSGTLPSSGSHGRRSTDTVSPVTSLYEQLDAEISDAIISANNDENVDEVDLAGPQRMYLPGAIRLEPHPAKLRRDSVATMDPFEGGLVRREKRFSDMVVLDSVAMFFEGFGNVEQITKSSLDRYWLKESALRQCDNRTPSATSVEETTVVKPLISWGPRGSKLTFFPASSNGSEPTPKRLWVRRLLSPALRASAFLKTPASRGQQTGTP